MKILLTGASGFVGRNLLVALTKEGHEVVPVSRRHGVDVTQLQSADGWMSLVQGVDVVINAVGIIGETRSQTFEALHTLAPKALFTACQRAGVRRVIQISSLGADESAFSAYHLSKKAADNHLRSLELDWFILRPSVIYGRGGTSTQMFMRIARLPIIPVVGDGRYELQPVHVADVVATVLACLQAPNACQTLDIVGNEAVAYVEWLQRLRAAQGRPRASVLGLPVWLVMAAAVLGRPFSPALRPENIRMLMKSYTADATHWHTFLGRRALTYRPSLLYADAIQALADMKEPA